MTEKKKEKRKKHILLEDGTELWYTEHSFNNIKVLLARGRNSDSNPSIIRPNGMEEFVPSSKKTTHNNTAMCLQLFPDGHIEPDSVSNVLSRIVYNNHS